jgi:hypothetical protein
MEKKSEQKVRAEASRGKNEPMARNPKVATNQNAEVRPTRAAARAQPGTDESAKAR